MPFGGYKESGLGRELGEDALVRKSEGVIRRMYKTCANEYIFHFLGKLHTDQDRVDPSRRRTLRLSGSFVLCGGHENFKRTGVGSLAFSSVTTYVEMRMMKCTIISFRSLSATTFKYAWISVRRAV